MFFLGLFGVLALMIWVTWRIVLILPAIFLFWFLFASWQDAEHHETQRQDNVAVINSFLNSPVNCSNKDSDLEKLEVVVSETSNNDGPKATDWRSRAKSKIWQIHRECE